MVLNTPHGRRRSIRDCERAKIEAGRAFRTPWTLWVDMGWRGGKDGVETREGPGGYGKHSFVVGGPSQMAGRQWRRQEGPWNGAAWGWHRQGPQMVNAHPGMYWRRRERPMAWGMHALAVGGQSVVPRRCQEVPCTVRASAEQIPEWGQYTCYTSPERT